MDAAYGLGKRSFDYTATAHRSGQLQRRRYSIDFAEMKQYCLATGVSRHVRPPASTSSSPSNIESSTTVFAGRKLRKSSASKPAVQRLFETMHMDPDLCCYGVDSTIRALELFIVDELIVMEQGSPGGLTLTSWAALAAEHKVACVHAVSMETPNGKKFCQNFHIAGILSQRMESWRDSPTHSYSPDVACASNMGQSWLEGACMSPRGKASIPVQVLQPAVQDSSQAHTAAVQLQEPENAMGAFLQWLKHAVTEELAEDLTSALALCDCVEVVCSCTEEEFLHEALDNAVALLADEAPTCAAELRVRWHAASLAQSKFDLSVVASGHVAQLPEEAFHSSRQDASEAIQAVNMTNMLTMTTCRT
eukprot:gnl/TRDRNA2_/TRDRNA2_45221_c0_seq1.p1 gnl/TRDRNA2_/TRDRNA2_45221_c0~~gnl/TRDRNA2_/TRDRNA2_45221_c0_seq1.p1  ORF type:complete len:403 (-),score=70.97 gnl/TRDRNA2_/TRDRNA2_45221_c0_seq1:495-1583(-)